MKKISESIVGNIQKIADRCEFLVNENERIVSKHQPDIVYVCFTRKKVLLLIDL